MKRKAKRTVPRLLNEVRKSSKHTLQIHDGMGTTMPPDKEVLMIYFDQKGEGEMANEFFNEHDGRGWKTPTGATIYNWKVCAAEWIYNHRQNVKRRFRQSPFYSESF
ncbi:hypothetical protein FPZ43_18000 [Mucilaginibacter pallidiroseus]|uniref:Uncharacterized protein n=1 Tax=Mucilaginibacter pallidiroseus TaxID=2599295 RepID=A0A563U262_9SPHI|nr:hypothetical protein [Mucilaginibacter pallidiroseus]TWR24789.1 hypothetical protein FPZ43_18000 [Mucilaginibacter pallidiroseus]